jgi:hypothetical protein
MSTKSRITEKGDMWEWEHSPETEEALKKLHQDQKSISELEQTAPDYGVGK